MSATPIDITKESPFDSATEPAPGPLVQIKPAQRKSRLLPSMYNAATAADDGSLIVWNTYRGTISVFKPEQKAVIEALLKDGYTGEPKGVVKYLSERGLLVSEDINEYRQFQLTFGKQHYRQDTLELILLASEDCNFRCRYCYEEFPRGTMQPSVRENIRKLVRKRAAGLTRFSVGWFGGEPLYGFKAIEDLAPFFVEVAEEFGLDYASHMTTNGYLLTPDVAEKLLAWKVGHFQITVDGVAAQHDHNRPTRDGQGTFDTIISNLQALKKRDESFGVNVRVNFDKENHPYLEDLFTLLQQEFGDDPRFHLTLHSVGKWGGPNDAELPVCGIGEGKQVKLKLQKSVIAKGLTLKGTLRDMMGPGKGVCYAARPYNYIIGADGKIMKCTVALDKQDHNIVGMLTDEGDIKLNYENYALWVEPAYASDHTCQQCNMLPSCQGISCPLVRIEKAAARPCAATPKINLHNELLVTLETYKASARAVTVSGGD